MDEINYSAKKHDKDGVGFKCEVEKRRDEKCEILEEYGKCEVTDDVGDKSEVIGETTITPPNNDSAKRQRHWFVTLFLCILLYLNISSLIDDVSYFLKVGFRLEDFLFIVFYILNIEGVLFLFFWKKLGFWMITGSVAILCVFMPIIYSINYTYIDFSVGLFSIGVLALWAVLQIKKNGISCWKQLE